MGEGKRGKPGSELERLQIFAQLATEYFRMVELFAPGGGPVPVDPVEGERRHWVELFRAALLRKFIVPDEHVSLKLVVRALRLCNYSADPRLTEGTEEAAALFTNEMIRGRPALLAGLAVEMMTMTCSRTFSTGGSCTATQTGFTGPDGRRTTTG